MITTAQEALEAAARIADNKTAQARYLAVHSETDGDHGGARHFNCKADTASEIYSSIRALSAQIAPVQPQGVAALRSREVLALVTAARAMVAHLDEWQATGAIATPEQSEALYDGLSAALAALAR